MEFELAPVVTTDPHKNPQGVAISTGQVTVEGDWQFGANGALHFRFNSAHYGADQGARIVSYALPAPDGAWHKITAEYDLQFVTIKRDGVVVVRDWLDQVTTEIPSRPGLALSFNTPIRNIKATPFAVAPILPEVRWQGVVGNSSVPNHGPSMWATFFPANAMCAWGDYVFVCFGFNEAFPELVRFHKNNPQATDLQFGMRHLATLDEVRVPVDLAIGTDNLLYVKRANGLVTKFDPNTGKALSPLNGSAIGFPAPAPRPVPLADQTWSVNGKIIGEPNGYANGTDIKLTRFAHWFIDGGRKNRSAACFQNDGKVWLSDTATTRLIRFNADGTPDGTVIHWTPHSYVMAVDKNNRRRVFNRFIEYLDGQPVRFYGNDPDVIFNFGEGFSSVATINGETLATKITRDYLGRRQIVKLTDAGIIPTGRLIEKGGLLEKDGSIVNNTRTVDGVNYNFQSGGVTGYHLTATRNGATLWQAMPTGNNTGNGTFDLRCESGVQTAAPGCIAVAGPYVITACKMEFWKNGHTGQGNQLFIHDKVTGKFLRQFGLPLMHRGEIDHAPGAASNIFSLDAWENPDGTLTVISNDEWGKGAQVWKVFPSAPPSGGLATVIIQATDASASETAADQGTFTVSRTGDTSAPLTVNYTISGSAQNGTDYNAIGNSVTIPAGAASAPIAVVPQSDSLVESTETVTLSLASSTGYILGSPATATLNLLNASVAPPPPPPVTNLPDLIVTAFTLTPATPKAGDKIQFSVTIKNQGLAATLPNEVVSVGFYVDGGMDFITGGSPKARATLGSALGIGASVTLTAAEGPEAGLWTATAGTHIFSAVVDMPNLVNESNGSNNVMNKTVTVAAPPPIILPTVNLTASDPAASEPSGTGTFTVTRSGSTAAALAVIYTIGGTAQNSVDYNAIANSVVIPAGAASANVIITPIDDSEVESAETVILTLQSSGAYALGSSTTATVSITDNDVPPPVILPTINVTATDPNAAEPSNPGVFTITRSGGSAGNGSALTVKYFLGGTAQNGTDYSTLGNYVVIPAGSASATVTITPIDDSTVEPDETAILTLQLLPEYTLGTASSATVTIADNDAPPPPVVTGGPDLIVTGFTISPSIPKAGDAIRFSATIKNQGSVATPFFTTIAIAFYVDGGDNFINGGTPKAWTSIGSLAPGASATVISSSGLQSGLWTATAGNHLVAAIVDIPNRISEVNENNNTAVRGLTVPYPVASSTAVTPITAPPAVTVTATDPTAAEIDDTGTFTFRRSGGTNADLLVYYQINGSATYARDYGQLPVVITIPAGSSSVAVPILPVKDGLTEGTESVTITIVSNRTYRVAQPGSATITILDNSNGGTHSGTNLTASATAPRVSLSMSYSAGTERTNDVRNFIFTRRGGLGGDLVVNYSVSGTAANGVDYQPIDGTVVIPDGKNTATVAFRPIDDLDTEPIETVILTLTPSPNYSIGVGSVQASLRDNDYDMDRDGVSDAQEILNGTNPLDAKSH